MTDLLGYALEYKVTLLSGTFFLNVQCVLSSLKSFYYDCLSIKCCILASLVSLRFFMLLMAVFKDELLLIRDYMLRCCSATSPPHVGIQWMD